jgi:hypothetical protein
MIRLLRLPQRDGDTLHQALKARLADLPAACATTSPRAPT